MKNKQTIQELSIILPAYNEERNIHLMIEDIVSFMRKYRKIKYEIQKIKPNFMHLFFFASFNNVVRIRMLFHS